MNNFLTDSFSNPYNAILSILIILFLVTLFLSIFSPKVRASLIKWRILEKEESPTKLLIIIVAIFLFIKLIQAFVIQPFLVDGGSMLPNIKSGELLLIDKLGFDVNNLQRGDVIVFRHVKPDKFNGKFFIKRLIGLPGDRVVVKDGVTTIYNAEHPEGEILDEYFVQYKDPVRDMDITLGPNEYITFGDNRAESYDSRSWGVVYKKDIAGKAILAIYPFKFFGSDPGKVKVNFVSAVANDR